MKFKVIAIILLVLFLVGAFTGSSHVTDNFCTAVNSIVALASGIVTNVAHGATWIIGGVGHIFG